MVGMCFCSFWNGPFFRGWWWGFLHFRSRRVLVPKTSGAPNPSGGREEFRCDIIETPTRYDGVGGSQGVFKKTHRTWNARLGSVYLVIFWRIVPWDSSPLNHYLGDFLKNLFQVFYANPRRWWVLSRLWKRWGCNKSYKWSKIDGELGLNHPSYRG